VNKLLNHDLNTRSQILDETRKMALAFLQKQDELPPGRTVDYLGEVPLPESGLGALETLR